MKISKTLWALVAASGLLLAGFNSQAVPIVGGISMAGGYVPTGALDSGPISFAFPTGAFVTSSSGSYAPVPGGTPATYFGFSAVPSSAPQALWTFMFAGLTYSFDLGTLSVLSRGLDGNGNPFINLEGTGTLKITGFTDTPGSWLFTANSASSTFSFSSSNGAIPDGGTTVMLLGAGLAALGMARRYFVKA